MSRDGNLTGGSRFALVLGGGGMRGLAHVGALRALHEAGWEPAEVFGTSMGALAAGAWAAGYSVAELESIAIGIRRRDVFRIAHGDMALKRMRSPALYESEPLESLVAGLLGDVTFRELPRRLVIGAVEINSGTQVYFGLPGFEDVRVADAVFASCALPGFFAPREIQGRWFMDGAVVDNFPVRLAAARGHDFVVGVDVGASSVLRADLHEAGFAAVFARASEIVFQQASEWHLKSWQGPPLLLVQPRVEHIRQFSFQHTRELMLEGERATALAIEAAGAAVRAGEAGIHPRRRMLLDVKRERCTGCGVCLSTAPPGMFRLDELGKAVAPPDPVTWSPIDGGFVRQCPAWAITARPLAAEPSLPSTGGASRGTGRGSA
jgi:NTE family protein